MNRKERRKLLREEKKSDDYIDSTKINNVDESKGFFKRIYENNYKQLIIIPFAILIIAIVLIGINIANTGDFVNKGFSLSGGVSITVTANNVDIVKIENFLRSQLSDREINVREITEAGQSKGFIVESNSIGDNDNGDEIIDILDEVSPGLKNSDSISVTTMGPSLGASFFKSAIIAVILAFIFMSVVVFFIFKKVAPSLAVILCAFSDIVVTIATINVLGIKLSTAGIAAILMLIGYSVDTDILLSTRVIKEKKGTVMQRIYSALRTGFTMNLTTFATVFIGLVLSQSAELNQIFTILLIGLIIDVINTWIQNVGILRWYLEKQETKLNIKSDIQ